MVVHYAHLVIDERVKKIILKEGLKMYLHHNPDAVATHISHSKLVWEIVRFYLDLPKGTNPEELHA